MVPVPDWKLTAVQPGQPAHWSFAGPAPRSRPAAITSSSAPSTRAADGVPLRFANATRDADRPGWLTLGAVTISSPQPPRHAP